MRHRTGCNLRTRVADWKHINNGHRKDICKYGGIDMVPIAQWGPDYTKVTQEEVDRIKAAEESGVVPADEADWNDLSKYAG